MRQFAFICVLCLFPAIAQAQAEKYALLVGVTKYNNARMNDTKLEYPEADAIAVAELLRGSGYTVKTLLGRQATKKAVEAALSVAARKGNSDGVLLIGVFGHGIQYGKDAYFGPFDTTTRRVKDAGGNAIFDDSGLRKLEPDPASMVSMNSILGTLNSSGAGNRVLLADCCREDPSRARGRAFGSTVKMSDLRRGTAALFSCSEFEKAFEHEDWKHGAFTRAFLDECKLIASTDRKVRANTLADDVYDRVRRMVQRVNGKFQTVNPIVNGIVDLQLSVSRTAATHGLDVTNSIGMKFKRIPGGTFVMGSRVSAEFIARMFDSSATYYEDEHPRHQVEISGPFFLGVHEVTVAQFHNFVRESGYKTEAEKQRKGGRGINRKSELFEDGRQYSWRSPGFPQGSDHPVTNVSWNDAVAFCEWLTRKEEINYRLPTEAEWEYCCRANSASLFHDGDNTEGLIFVGNTPDGTAKKQFSSWKTISGSDGYTFTAPVGRFRSNGFGLCDMHGNVAEWCRDWHGEDYYKQSPSRDPTGPDKGSFRVNRGGGWSPAPQNCRAAYRRGYPPSYRDSALGFRVLRNAQE